MPYQGKIQKKTPSIDVGTTLLRCHVPAGLFGVGAVNSVVPEVSYILPSTINSLLVM